MKAIISTESWESLQSQALAIAQQVDAGEGESLPEADYHLSFADSAQLFSELTPARLALLEQLKRLGTASIQTLAELGLRLSLCALLGGQYPLSQGY
ncbi:hypothetical protein [Halochromatium roseum]|uniref:HVO_A0114 family putative DNA-binding protein n=1 Tax=Halochromatium roseum TaxID=391920 RepID=UPI0019145D53|nr:hypothetical protein [Halochromatium roseum]MBK5940866.1 hypothetical protein [Halochromatium roseum]